MKLSTLIFSIAFAWLSVACTGSENTDGADATDPSVAAETSDASDASDATSTSDASDASDTSDTSDSSDSSDTADASDSTDASDATDSSDASEVADASDPSDTPSVTTVEGIRDLGLSGDVPRVSAELADFAATNSDGNPRGPPDIAGSPTVLWFFPAAGTYG